MNGNQRLSCKKTGKILSENLLGLIVSFACFIAPLNIQASEADVDESATARMMKQYTAAMAADKESLAIKHVVDYSEATYGKNNPKTVKLLHKYGKLLYDDGDYKTAARVLLEAKERANIAFGPFGETAYQLNMDLAYAYSKWRSRLSLTTKYFDYALEALRERGQHESQAYLFTLVNIAVHMMEGDGLKGQYSTSFELEDENENENEFENDFTLDREYRNKYYLAEKYIQQAVELAEKLNSEDPYLSSKIDIVVAKLKVMETADLAAVPFDVFGSISSATEEKFYMREDSRLQNAIEVLSRDIEKNQVFLTTANSSRLEIAWRREDEGSMARMCSNGTLDMSSEYPSHRLYEITEGGFVQAPGLSMRISKNIFKPLRSSGFESSSSDGDAVNRPQFIPVCIDGHLMAALINAPDVSVEEVR